MMKLFQPKNNNSPPSPFFQYMKDKYQEKLLENPNASIINFLEKAIVEWDNDPSLRRYFEKKSNTKNFAYPEEEEEEEEEVVRTKPKHSKKEKPAPPAKPKTAYFLYVDDNREAIKAERPGIGFIELSKILADRWKESDNSIKAMYQQRQAEEKEKYQDELSEYERLYGPVEKPKRYWNF